MVKILYLLEKIKEQILNSILIFFWNITKIELN